LPSSSAASARARSAPQHFPGPPANRWPAPHHTTAKEEIRALCGFARDRGFLFPELTESATRREGAEVTAGPNDGCFSSSRTREIGMTRATGQIYRSYLYLLEQATRP